MEHPFLALIAAAITAGIASAWGLTGLLIVFGIYTAGHVVFRIKYGYWSEKG